MKARRVTALVSAVLATAAIGLTGCGKVNPNATAATLDGKAISAGLVNFAAQATAVEYDTYYLSYYGPTMWTEDEGDGTTMAGNVKEEVIDEIKQQYLLDAHQADYSVSLSDEDNKKIDAAVEEFFSENDPAALKKMGATKEIVKEYLRLKTVESLMQKAIGDTVDTEVSDEEAAQRTFSYYHITLPEEDAAETGAEEETEGEDLELAAYAITVATAAKDDFDGVEELYSQTKLQQSYGKDEEGFDAKVTEAADALSEGEVSDLIEGEDGNYYVVRLESEFDADATEARKDEIVEERKQDKIDEVVSDYEEKAAWTTVDSEIAKINFDTFYQMAYDEVETEAAE